MIPGISRRASGQLSTIAAWWREHRPAAPNLPLDELEAALVRLTENPALGEPYPVAGAPGLRRVLLRRSRYHVYYSVVVERDLLLVEAIWHASRRRGPTLR